MNLPLKLPIDLSQLVSNFLARSNLQDALARYGQMNLALIEPAQIKLVDNTRLIRVIDWISRY